MRSWKRTSLAMLAGVGLALSGAAVAVAAEPGTPPLPYDPFAHQDYWIELPSHVACEPGGENFAELTIALSEDWAGGSEFEFYSGTADAPSSPDGPGEHGTGFGSESVGAGEWVTVRLPIDDRGLTVWINDVIYDETEEEPTGPVGGTGDTTSSLRISGLGPVFCQAPPVEPEQHGNTLVLPEIEGVSYFVAPREIDGHAVSGFVDGDYFVGFVESVTGAFLGDEPSTGTVEIPEAGLQVFAAAGRTVFSYGFRNPVTTYWQFDAETDVVIPEPELPVTPELPPAPELPITDGGGTPPLAVTGGDPSEADLTEQSRGSVEVLTTAVAGGAVTVDVGRAYAGERVDAFLFSDPVHLGTFTVASDGTIRVTLPGDITGQHRLAVYAADGTIIGWDDITIAEAGVSGDGELAATGNDLPVAAALGSAGALLLLGAALTLRSRFARRG